MKKIYLTLFSTALIGASINANAQCAGERYFNYVFPANPIVTSNIDYGLIFLVFTLPYILKDKITYLRIILLVLIAISFNSIWFDLFEGDRFTFTYLALALFIHSIKIVIFSVICFYFGEILNNHIKIKFK